MRKINFFLFFLFCVCFVSAIDYRPHIINVTSISTNPEYSYDNLFNTYSSYCTWGCPMCCEPQNGYSQKFTFDDYYWFSNITIASDDWRSLPTAIDIYCNGVFRQHINTSSMCFNTGDGVHTNRSFLINPVMCNIINLSYSTNCWSNGYGGATMGNEGNPRISEIFWESYNLTYENEYPDVNLPDLKSTYCYNESWPIYHFTPNITDIENDDISWRYYWGSDPYAKTYIDQFTDDNYNMLDNGWDFNQSGCNYTTTNDELRLTDDCDNIAMIKWLYPGQLSNETTVSFKTVLFRNNSAEYCIYSWQNEKLTCMKIETFYDVNQQEHYSNLSYWNGSKYIYFDQSYSDGYLDVEYIMNGSDNHICAIDEYSTDDCTYEITIPLLGTGQKNPAKFYMVGHYGYYYNGFYGSWNTLDDLAYDEYGIAWDPYIAGDEITHEFDQQGQEDLNILVTDNVNYPEYSRHVFPISVYGICSTQFNDTNTTFPDVTTDYINAIDNGPTVFNIVFYFVLFLFFIWMMFNSGSVELSLIAVGAVGLLGSFIMSKDLTQMISSGSLIVLGLSLIIAKVF